MYDNTYQDLDYELSLVLLGIADYSQSIILASPVDRVVLCLTDCEGRARIHLQI